MIPPCQLSSCESTILSYTLKLGIQSKILVPEQIPNDRHLMPFSKQMRLNNARKRIDA